MKVLLVPCGGISAKNQISSKDTLPRCLKALELWQTGQYDRIVVTGGIFLPQHIQTVPAGEIMRQWFEKQGIEHDKILVENKSLDTYENVRYVLDKLKEREIENPEITLVTQWQHSWRFWLTFRSYGIKIKRHKVKFKISWLTWLLEFAFIFIHLIDPKGIWFFGRINRKKRNRKSPSE